MSHFRKKGYCFFLALVFLIAGVLSGCSSAPSGGQSKGNEADGYKDVNIRLAYNLPQDHHVSKGVEDLAKKVTERSGGKVKVQVYPAGQLLSDKEMNQAILTGGVEMGVNSSTLWASFVPSMAIIDVPFVFPKYELAAKAFTGEVGKQLSDAMEKKGAKILIFADYGYVQFANNVRPLKTPADFHGLKIRTYGDFVSETVKAYGAAPVFMGAGEVYTALQRKTIDGLTSGATAMSQRKVYEVAKYLTVCDYTYLEFILAVNKKFWDGLPPKTQELLTTTAKETELWIRAQAETEDKQAIEKLKANGMEVYVVPPNDIQAWKEAAKSTRDTFITKAGDEGKRLLEAVDKLK